MRKTHFSNVPNQFLEFVFRSPAALSETRTRTRGAVVCSGGARSADTGRGPACGRQPDSNYSLSPSESLPPLHFSKVSPYPTLILLRLSLEHVYVVRGKETRPGGNMQAAVDHVTTIRIDLLAEAAPRPRTRGAVVCSGGARGADAGGGPAC